MTKTRIKVYVLVAINVVVIGFIIFHFNKRARALEEQRFRERPRPERVAPLETPPPPETSHNELLRPLVASGKERAEAQRARQAWKEHFPYTPTHDPRVTFDQARHLLGPEQSNTDQATGANHLILTRFFEDEVRFSPQFEALYRMLEEHDRGDNPVLAARLFSTLTRFHHTNDRRWLESALGTFTSWEWLNPSFMSHEGEAAALALREELCKAIPDMDAVPPHAMGYAMSGGLDATNPEAPPLISGEEALLVPYVGWNEKSEAWWEKQHEQFLLSVETGDPSLKAALPELFAPSPQL